MPAFLERLYSILDVDSKEITINLLNWEFDEYLVEGFDSSVESSLPLLSAHLYYRSLKALPTLVRAWFAACRNRQLNLAVERFYMFLIIALLSFTFHP